MAIIIPTAAEVVWAEVMSGLFGTPTLEMCLYKNDVDPDQDSVIGDFDIADFDDYTSRPLSSPSSNPVPDGDGAIVTTFDLEVWIKGVGTTGNSIYGYFVRDANVPTNLYWCERAPGAPISMAVVLDSLSILPIFRFRQRP